MARLLRWLRALVPFGRRAANGEDAPSDQAAAAVPPAAGDAAKQAVVLIHGMGEQIPMDSVKGFVRTIWCDDARITANGLPEPTRVWSKPDDRTGSLELRRITTRESIAGGAFPKGVRTDFYELYWADLTAGSTWQQFTSWVGGLLFRPWAKVPKDVRLAWILLWLLSAAVVAASLLQLVPDATWRAFAPDWLPQKVALALTAALGAALHQVATCSFGRVVRYTRAEPDNIAARAAVRKRGLEMLRALHADGSYERVVVVGHSLGTILAYDLVTHFWAERARPRTIAEGTPAFAALCAAEHAALRLESDRSQAAVDAYRDAQNALRRTFQPSATGADPDAVWLISDLVTLGSPLTHAEFLLARDPEDLANRAAEREYPVIPPYRERLDPKNLPLAQATGALPIAARPEETRLMAYPVGPKSWRLHHAAPFAAVRWTNLHDPARLVVFGDLISGPVAGNFGPAAVDIDLAALDRRSWRFTHTRYWHGGAAPARLAALRRAVNLLDE